MFKHYVSSVDQWLFFCLRMKTKVKQWNNSTFLKLHHKHLSIFKEIKTSHSNDRYNKPSLLTFTRQPIRHRVISKGKEREHMGKTKYTSDNHPNSTKPIHDDWHKHATYILRQILEKRLGTVSCKSPQKTGLQGLNRIPYLRYQTNRVNKINPHAINLQQQLRQNRVRTPTSFSWWGVQCL